MAANKLQWRRIAKGDKLPCQSFLRKKNGEILKLSTVAGVTVGQDAYYLPVDDVINVIKDYPVEESEDGKIRKALVEMVHDTVGDSLWVDYNVHKEDAIAWLEKQGEPKEHDVCDNCEQQGNCVSPCCVKLVEKNGEQKPAEWSEDDQSNFCELSSFIFETYRAEDASRLLTWFNELKDRVQPQPKQEWSEDVEAAIRLLKNIAEEQEKDYCPYNANNLRKAAQYLETCRPQNTWKPSDEQMTALRRMKNAIGGEGEIYEPLNSLYEDLKKLKA